VVASDVSPSATELVPELMALLPRAVELVPAAVVLAPRAVALAAVDVVHEVGVLDEVVVLDVSPEEVLVV